jgi:hypothetical protein
MIRQVIHHNTSPNRQHNAKNGDMVGAVKQSLDCHRQKDNDAVYRNV